MGLTRHRMGPTFRHESFCCGVHLVDGYPEPECVDLGWIHHAASTGKLLIDGVQCNPQKFYDEVQKFVEVKTNWESLEKDSWDEPI